MSPDLLTAPTLWALLEARCALTPHATLLIDGASGQRWSAAQVRALAERRAARLLAVGIGPGSVVTWQLPTSVSAFVTALALARLGAVQNPLISLYREREVAAVLSRSGSGHYLIPAQAVAGRDFVALACEVCATLPQPPQVVMLDEEEGGGPVDPASLPPAPVDGDALRWVYYTSGTTSEPKGARHSDQTLLIGGLNLARSLQAGTQDVGCIAFPIGHIGGAMYTVMLLASGASAVLLGRFVPAEAVAAFQRHGVTLAGGSTPHYAALLAEQRKAPGQPLLRDLRVLSGGGAPKPPALFFDVQRELGCVIAHSYGMTEVPLISAGSVAHSDEQLAYSDGHPVADVSVRIVRADGSEAPAGESGEVRVRGPGVFKGYTEAGLNELAFDAQGWFHTGDLGRLRLDGHLALTGRLKDMIIRKGENISAQEIEDLLYTHPKVAAVAVIGLPDELRGERVCAVVEAHPGAAPLRFDEMVAWFEAADVMRQKIPEQLEVVERLPRNETLNKVLKHELRARFSSPPG
jgi:acyl-CoA synthetase (AMP-forming)/AMP-acid ligase II